MNLTSALIYRVLEEHDFDTWSNVRKHYLPNEYHQLFDVIEKHAENFHKLPTIEELKLEIRDGATLDKVYALEGIETEVEPNFLLEAVKNEYIQRETLSQLDKWVDNSIAFETAEEVVRHIQQIGIELEMKAELTPPEESMQKINLFETEEEAAGRIRLGLNAEFDSMYDFLSTDYIMFGGRRGSGKSIICSNLCRTTVNKGKKALMFSVEMKPRELLQRDASIATGISHYKIKNRNLDIREWEQLARWWSSRFVDGEVAYEAYLKHREFDRFHKAVSRHPLVSAFVDIVYDSGLTLGRITAEVRKRLTMGEDIGLIAIDYVNKVKRVGGSNHSLDHLDWKEQMNVSNAFKTLAQDTGIPVVSPYQTDKEGDARLAKGILDSCDAAFRLVAHKGDNPCMEFITDKMRGASDEEVFTSIMNWENLQIGPGSTEPPRDVKKGFGKPKQDITVQTRGVYDD